MFMVWNKDDEALWRRVPELSIHVEKITSRAHEKFEEHNKILEPSIVIINHCIIIINECYNYIV